MSDRPEDRREHTRAPIELKVEYKKMNTFFADYTKNISKGGTFIKTSKPLKIGTEFVFKLVIPALQDPIQIRGRVMWTNSEGNMTHPEVPDSGMGIKFLWEQDSQRDDFEQLVERLMSDSLGAHLVKKLVHGSDAMGFNLYLMRHGVAEDFDPSRMKSDADRHLTDEGRDKLKQQAKGLAKLDLDLGALLTSPFVRARETAELIMPGLKKLPLETMDELVPNAEVDALLESLRARQQTKPVLCFSHEPLVSSIVALVLGGGAMVEVKKGALIGLELSRLAPPWRGQLLFLLHPKAQRAMA